MKWHLELEQGRGVIWTTDRFGHLPLVTTELMMGHQNITLHMARRTNRRNVKLLLKKISIRNGESRYSVHDVLSYGNSLYKTNFTDIVLWISL